MILSRYEMVSLEKIKAWEKEQKRDFSDKLANSATKKIDALVKKIGPEKFQMLEHSIEDTLYRVMTLSSARNDADDIFEQAKKYGIEANSRREISRIDLALLDEFSSKLIDIQGRIAAYRGACLGAAGIFAANAEVSALLVQTFRMVQTIAVAYGFDTRYRVEKEIVLRIILAASGGSDIKFQSLKEIQRLQNDLCESQDSEAKTISWESAILGTNAIKGYASMLTSRLLLGTFTGLMPVISIVLGFRKSHKIISNSALYAFMIYRKRFIERKIKIQA